MLQSLRVNAQKCSQSCGRCQPVSLPQHQEERTIQTAVLQDYISRLQSHITDQHITHGSTLFSVKPVFFFLTLLDFRASCPGRILSRRRCFIFMWMSNTVRILLTFMINSGYECMSVWEHVCEFTHYSIPSDSHKVPGKY